MRLAILLSVLALAAAAPAWAQDPSADPDDVEEVAPVETPAGDADDDPADCRYADADYAYGRCCPPLDADQTYGADADYRYGCVASPSSGPNPAPKRRPAAQPLPAGALPVTGSEVWLILLAGLGLLGAGVGLRLRNAP